MPYSTPSLFVLLLLNLSTENYERIYSVVNFINILRAAFAQIFFSQKLQSQTVNGEKQWTKLNIFNVYIHLFSLFYIL